MAVLHQLYIYLGHFLVDVRCRKELFEFGNAVLHVRAGEYFDVSVHGRGGLALADVAAVVKLQRGRSYSTRREKQLSFK